MIPFLFLTMLLTGFIFEFSILLNQGINKRIYFLYSACSVFFMFWKEPYIQHDLVIMIVLIGVINFLIDAKTPFIRKWVDIVDSSLCIIALTKIAYIFLTYKNYL